METTRAYHERRAKQHRDQARQAEALGHHSIHLELAELHHTAALQDGHQLGLANEH